MISTRLLTIDDAKILTDLICENREFLAPWEPTRDEGYFTVPGQQAIVETVLEQYGRGYTVPHAILYEGQVVGRITLNDIVRGALLGCHVGYWVAPAFNGRGIASAALAEMVELAFVHLGLHRIQAGTLVHNFASQRVLERNGFIRFGLAPKYLRVAGEWQDHILFQLLAPED